MLTKNFLILLGVAVALCSTHLLAKECSSPISITKMRPSANERPSNVNSQGISMVFFNDIDWSSNGGCDCHQKWGFIKSNDDHLISHILMAKASQAPVEITIEDTLKVDNGCQIVAASIL